jgi:hypothetical protein
MEFWDEIRDLAVKQQGCAAKLDSMSGWESLTWQESKTLNVLYKEIRAGATLLRAMAGEMTKKQLDNLHLDIARPQSYQVYLARN